jgi:ribonuclease HI
MEGLPPTGVHDNTGNLHMSLYRVRGLRGGEKTRAVAEFDKVRAACAGSAFGTVKGVQIAMFPVGSNANYSLHAPSAEVRILASAQLALFMDGACPGNPGPAGWGAVVVEGCAAVGDDTPPSGGSAVARIFGPVELSPSAPAFLGAEGGSNNTGELSAICESLRWLLDHERSTRPVVLCTDSEYALNQVQALHKAHKNVALSGRSRELLAAVRARGRAVRFVHVKGHSGHAWNEEADRLANRGVNERSSSCGRIA